MCVCEGCGRGSGGEGLGDDAREAAGESLGGVRVSVVDDDVEVPRFRLVRRDGVAGRGVPDGQWDYFANMVGMLGGGLFAIIPVCEQTRSITSEAVGHVRDHPVTDRVPT